MFLNPNNCFPIWIIIDLNYYSKLRKRRRPYIYYFCNSFQALRIFTTLINFIFVFNISFHILFCSFFNCGNSSRIKFLSVKALRFICHMFIQDTMFILFWQIFQVIRLLNLFFFLIKFSYFVIRFYYRDIK